MQESATGSDGFLYWTPQRISTFRLYKNVKICSPRTHFFLYMLVSYLFSGFSFSSLGHFSFSLPTFFPFVSSSLPLRVEWVTHVRPLLICWMYSGVRPSSLSYLVLERGLLLVVLLFVHVGLSLRTAVFISPQCRGAPPPSLALSPSVYATESLTHTRTYVHIKHIYSEASSLPFQLFLFPPFFFFHTCFFFPLAFITLHIFLTSHHLLGSVLFPHALFLSCSPLASWTLFPCISIVVTSPPPRAPALSPSRNTKVQKPILLTTSLLKGSENDILISPPHTTTYLFNPYIQAVNHRQDTKEIFGG